MRLVIILTSRKSSKIQICSLTFTWKVQRGSGENFHFDAVTTRTDLGLYIGPWVRRALALKEKRNLVRGFFFVIDKGKRLALKDMEVDILDRIAAIQSKHSELIGVRVDVYDEYGLSRSFRRGSNSEALNRG